MKREVAKVDTSRNGKKGDSIAGTRSANDVITTPDEEFLTELTRKPTKKCKVSFILDKLGPERAAAVLKAYEIGVTPNSIATTLGDRGFPVTRWTLAKHLQNQCGCPK